MYIGTISTFKSQHRVTFINRLVIRETFCQNGSQNFHVVLGNASHFVPRSIHSNNSGKYLKYLKHWRKHVNMYNKLSHFFAV